jgi:hypothetical protein
LCSSRSSEERKKKKKKKMGFSIQIVIPYDLATFSPLSLLHFCFKCSFFQMFVFQCTPTNPG